MFSPPLCPRLEIRACHHLLRRRPKRTQTDRSSPSPAAREEPPLPAHDGVGGEEGRHPRSKYVREEEGTIPPSRTIVRLLLSSFRERRGGGSVSAPPLVADMHGFFADSEESAALTIPRKLSVYQGQLAGCVLRGQRLQWQNRGEGGRGAGQCAAVLPPACTQQRHARTSPRKLHRIPAACRVCIGVAKLSRAARLCWRSRRQN